MKNLNPILSKHKFFGTILLFLATSFGVQSQSMNAFEKLVNKTWKAEGKWQNGGDFRQELRFSYDLDKSLVIVKTYGYTDQDGVNFGLRNHGIRNYNSQNEDYEFTEYDIFGGITKGKLSFEEFSIIYAYDYAGIQMEDRWDYVNDSTYLFTVVGSGQGKSKETYISTTFVVERPVFDLHSIGKMLLGDWKAKAWEGSLEETWERNGDSYTQKAVYYEEGEVVYEAQNFLEIKAGELILCTIIKDGSPKIFKAVLVEDKKVVFENMDYSNPNRLTYTFLDNGFTRKIEGHEGGAPTSYLFEFQAN